MEKDYDIKRILRSIKDSYQVINNVKKKQEDDIRMILNKFVVDQMKKTTTNIK